MTDFLQRLKPKERRGSKPRCHLLTHGRANRDSHYQMSNRFAWAWKLTELGIPVLLVYLGFLRAEEMRDRGKLFVDHSEWEQFVKAHSKALFPTDVWNHRWMVNGQLFITLIRSIEQPLTLQESNA